METQTQRNTKNWRRISATKLVYIIRIVHVDILLDIDIKTGHSSHVIIIVIVTIGSVTVTQR